MRTLLEEVMLAEYRRQANYAGAVEEARQSWARAMRENGLDEHRELLKELEWPRPRRNKLIVLKEVCDE